MPRPLREPAGELPHAVEELLDALARESADEQRGLPINAERGELLALLFGEQVGFAQADDAPLCKQLWVVAA
jgi:hypothetical protein